MIDEERGLNMSNAETELSITAKRVKKLMQARGMSATELASAANITDGALSFLLSGKRSAPSLSTLIGLAAALRTSVDYLAGTTDDPMPRSGASLPDYALEIIDQMQTLDRSRNLELLRIAQAFADAQQEAASLRKTELVAQLLEIAGQVTTPQEAETLASMLLALEQGQRGVALLSGVGDVACLGN